MSGIIRGLGGWLRNSFIDFPGTVSTVLFFNRCNLRCPYCHNPEFTNGARSQEERSNEIWKFLEKRRNVIKGVVLTGGEPTLFKNIVELSYKIKELGYKLKLDTNGLQPEMIDEIEPDYLALDIKTIFKNYKKYLNSDKENIEECLLKSIECVKKMGEQAEIRITVAPIIIDEFMKDDISMMLRDVKKVYLQKFSFGSHILDSDFFKNENNPQIDLLQLKKAILRNTNYCEIR